MSHLFSARGHRIAYLFAAQREQEGDDGNENELLRRALDLAAGADIAPFARLTISAHRSLLFMSAYCLQTQFNNSTN